MVNKLLIFLINSELINSAGKTRQIRTCRNATVTNFKQIGK